MPIASRTSPTNIGLQLLGTLAAYDLGYLTTSVLAERIDRTLQTLSHLPRYHGHFYNWYDTRSLNPLQPLYVSTVDSGNLVGCLITLREGLRDAVARDPIVDARFLRGLDDQLGLLVDALETRSGRARVHHPHTSRLLRDIALARQRLTTVPRALAGWLWLFEDLADRMDSLDLLLREIEDTATTGTEAAVLEARYWLTECARSLRERRGDLTAVSAHWTDGAADEQGVGVVLPSWEQLMLASATAPGRDLLESASRLDATIAGLISEMNFEFLYNPERRLFSIGFNVSDLRLDASHYDLLASEARLASFLAIALGQVPHEHWFTLGRAQVPPPAAGAAVVERIHLRALMPLLVMRAYPNTLIEESCQSRSSERSSTRADSAWRGASRSPRTACVTTTATTSAGFGVPGLGSSAGWATTSSWRPTRRCWPAPSAARRRGKPGRHRARLAERPLRVSRRRRLHGNAASEGRALRAGRHLHGPSSGHDPGGDRQRRQRRSPAAQVPSGTADPGGGPAAARAHSAAGAAERSADRGGVRHPDGTVVAAAAGSAIRDAAHRGPARPSALERPLLGADHERRIGVQPLRRDHADAMARGSHARQSRDLLLCARRRERIHVVCGVSADACRRRAVRSDLRAGSSHLQAPRRHHRAAHGNRRVARRRRRAAAGVRDQSGTRGPARGADQLRRGRAGSTGRRRGPPGLRQPVRRNRVRARSRRVDLPQAAAWRRAIALPRARRRQPGLVSGGAIRKRSAAFRRPAQRPAASGCPQAARAALEHRGRDARPHREPASSGSHPSRCDAASLSSPATPSPATRRWPWSRNTTIAMP